jgi:hypothetical protein
MDINQDDTTIDPCDKTDSRHLVRHLVRHHQAANTDANSCRGKEDAAASTRCYEHSHSINRFDVDAQ